MAQAQVLTKWSGADRKFSQRLRRLLGRSTPQLGRLSLLGVLPAVPAASVKVNCRDGGGDAAVVEINAADRLLAYSPHCLVCWTAGNLFLPPLGTCNDSSESEYTVLIRGIIIGDCQVFQERMALLITEPTKLEGPITAPPEMLP